LSSADIAIYRDGAAWYTSAIPIAGQHFTNDIAVGLGVPPTTAEAIKLAHGSAEVDGVDLWSLDLVEGRPREFELLE
jgi:cell division protein FtsA